MKMVTQGESMLRMHFVVKHCRTSCKLIVWVTPNTFKFISILIFVFFCSFATLVVTVGAPPNNPPVARDDFYSTERNTPVTSSLTVNDYDPDGGDFILVAPTPVAGPSNGSVTISPDGAFTYTVSTTVGFPGSQWAQLCPQLQPWLWLLLTCKILCFFLNPTAWWWIWRHRQLHIPVRQNAFPFAWSVMPPLEHSSPYISTPLPVLPFFPPQPG